MFQIITIFYSRQLKWDNPYLIIELHKYYNSSPFDIDILGGCIYKYEMKKIINFFLSNNLKLELCDLPEQDLSIISESCYNYLYL